MSIEQAKQSEQQSAEIQRTLNLMVANYQQVRRSVTDITEEAAAALVIAAHQMVKK